MHSDPSLLSPQPQPSNANTVAPQNASTPNPPPLLQLDSVPDSLAALKSTGKRPTRRQGDVPPLTPRRRRRRAAAASFSGSASGSASGSFSASASATASGSGSATASASGSATASGSASGSATASASGSASGSASASHTASLSTRFTFTVSPSVFGSASSTVRCAPLPLLLALCYYLRFFLFCRPLRRLDSIARPRRVRWAPRRLLQQLRQWAQSRPPRQQPRWAPSRRRLPLLLWALHHR